MNNTGFFISVALFVIYIAAAMRAEAYLVLFISIIVFIIVFVIIMYVQRKRGDRYQERYKRDQKRYKRGEE